MVSLWGFDPDRRPPGTFAAVDGLPHWLSARAGACLRALAASFDLAWCTGWEERANEHLVALLELPGPLPVLELERHALAAPTTPAHWKLPAIDDLCGPHDPVAWIDDAHDAARRSWARARPGPTLLVTTSPDVGLTEVEQERLEAWAASL